LAEGADLVVATPGRLSEHVRAGGLSLSSLRTVVLDEADVLLGEEASSSGLDGAGPSAFSDQVTPLRELAPPDAAFVLVTATLPEPTWERVAREFPGIAPVLGPGLHRTAPGVEQVLIDCSSPDEKKGGEASSSGKEGEEEEPRNAETAYLRKADALLKVLSAHPASHTVVFCNRVETCRRIENMINRKLKQSHLALPYHAAVERRAREGALAAFTGSSSGGGGGGGGGGRGGGASGGAAAATAATTAASSSSLSSPKKLVLVATDRASRGLDTSAVGHAVLFDFPRDPSEYVRRAGRVARGAARGGVSGGDESGNANNATTATAPCP
jgi:ATP-dependent RNA helicase DDX18/HAS1